MKEIEDILDDNISQDYGYIINESKSTIIAKLVELIERKEREAFEASKEVTESCISPSYEFETFEDYKNKE